MKSESNLVSRRVFVAGGASVVAGAALGLCAIPCKTGADTLRPPGVRSKDDLLARCIKCERCIDVCPTNVLEPSRIENGILQNRTPLISFSASHCTFCGLCQETCPTDAIGAFDPANFDAKDEFSGRIGVAVVHPDHCLVFKQPEACGICADACKYGALRLGEDRRPVVDADRCNGCGACESVCPANVFTTFGGGKVRGIEVVKAGTGAGK